MNKHAILPAFIVFLLPFLNDAIVFLGSGQSEKLFSAPAGLIGNAAFAAFPFLLIGSVMRPRRRVTIALWVIALITIVLWMCYALTGLSLQTDDRLMSLNFFIYMGLMVWPFLSVILMGVIAKIGEDPMEVV